MKKADLGKYGGPIIEFISGSLLSAATTVGFLTKSILPFVIIAGITGLLLAFTPLIIIGIKALIRKKELVVKATKEDEEKYSQLSDLLFGLYDDDEEDFDSLL
jgi:hypothetical protein